MDKVRAFQDLLMQQNPQISIGEFIVNLILAAILSYILSFIYIKYGLSLSNRKMFAKNFTIIAMTTTLIITIVKSSLALSLGLVGALSIVRFRAAIKEPEELSYLFLAIAIGLGFGAGQKLITLVAFPVLVGIIILKNFGTSAIKHQNLYLTVGTENSDKVALEDIVRVLGENSLKVNLGRFDESEDMLEASFLVEFSGFDQLAKAKEALKKLDSTIRLTFLDNKGFF